jgi:hypothetical protein
MSAASTTGIGQGSAEGANRGNEHMTLGVNHLIGPRCVYAGSCTMNTGTFKVTFPNPLSSSNVNYSVQVTPTATTTTVPYVVKHDNSNTVFDYFTIHAGTSDPVDFVVMTDGFVIDSLFNA